MRAVYCVHREFVIVSGNDYCRPLVSHLTCERVWEFVRGNVLVGMYSYRYGVTTDGQTVFMNASVCNHSYNPLNAPLIFDLPARK